MDPMPRLTLPPLPRNPLAVLSKDELRARVVVLEVANWQAERRAMLLAEELKAARAHSRLLVRKLAAKT